MDGHTIVVNLEPFLLLFACGTLKAPKKTASGHVFGRRISYRVICDCVNGFKMGLGFNVRGSTHHIGVPEVGPKYDNTAFFCLSGGI